MANQFVTHFIEEFRNTTHIEAIEDVFMNGYCFYFSVILHEACTQAAIESEMTYIPVYNHFCCRVEDQLYDVKGVITDPDMIRLAQPWEYYKVYEPIESARIFDQCILKL